MATRAMLATLWRRGPDSEGIEFWPGVALGHRRLAIIDLSPAGHQPMLSPDGQVGIVFNGCIYNYLELRQELIALGRPVKSQCDTEVIVHGYQEWGTEELLRRMRGMFAIGIWDQRLRKLTLIRDRLGVKPLLYARQNGSFAFASTLTALREAGMGGELNPEAVLEFLEFGYITDERAIYQGIEKLPPGHFLELCEGTITRKRYWDLPDRTRPLKIGFEEAVEETERLLVESVRLRLCSDVPIGALLSGGIDSALICWAMAQSNTNIRTFTVGTPGDPSDESAEARQTANILGVPHEVVELPRERPFLIEEMIGAYSEPFACQSAQAMLLVSRAVKSRATVLLTGDGGDDVFLGYPFFWNAWLAQRTAAWLPSFSTAVWKGLRPAVPAKGQFKRARSFIDFAVDGLSGHAQAHDGLPYYQERGMLGERLAGVVLRQRELQGSVKSARNLLNEVFAYHRKMHFTGEFMPKVDGATMYYSLEARSPLLDQKLWEFASLLPPEIHFHGGALKSVLREIARRRIGPGVANRRKQGFTVPVERWLVDRGKDVLGDLEGGRTALEDAGLVRRGTLAPAIRNAVSRQWAPVQIWYLVILEHWLREAKPAGCPQPAEMLPAGR